MSKIHKINNKQSFDQVIKSGKKYVSKSFVFFSLSSVENRFGVIASKSVGNAVKRNKAKRIFRNIIKDLFKDNINLSIVIICRKSFINYKYNEILEEVNKALTRTIPSAINN